MRAVPEKGEQSRWADSEAAGEPIPLPDLGDDTYLAAAFSMAGEISTTAMGDIQALSWQEVRAFRKESGAISRGWESETIIEMSRAYCREAAKAPAPLRIPPIERGKPKEAYMLAADD